MSYSTDRAIAAQNAGNTAAIITAAEIAVGIPFDSARFDSLRESIFQGTLSRGETANAVIQTFPGAAPVAPTAPAAVPTTQAAPTPTYSAPEAAAVGLATAPNGDIALKFGKYKGQSIQQVWDNPAPDRDGTPEGQNWLKWAADNSNNDFMRGKIQEFLAVAA